MCKVKERAAMRDQLLEEAKKSNILSKELITNLLNSLDYTTISFLNWSLDVLDVLRIRIERGDKIQDAVSGIVYDPESFKAFVKKNFSSYVFSRIYAAPKKEKVYFELEPTEGGYQLVIAPSSKEKVYQWISSLNKRFSLVKMIATDIVYIKDLKMNTYAPFISENGKYCRYSEKEGKIIEL